MNEHVHLRLDALQVSEAHARGSLSMLDVPPGPPTGPEGPDGSWTPGEEEDEARGVREAREPALSEWQWPISSAELSLLERCRDTAKVIVISMYVNVPCDFAERQPNRFLWAHDLYDMVME